MKKHIPPASKVQHMLAFSQTNVNAIRHRAFNSRKVSSKRLLLPTVIVSMSEKHTADCYSQVSMVKTAGKAKRKLTAPNPTISQERNKTCSFMYVPIEA